jgi:uncharacterized membrane protein YgcG
MQNLTHEEIWERRNQEMTEDEKRRKREKQKQEEEVDKTIRIFPFLILFLTLGLTTVFALVVFSGGPKNAGAWIGGFFVSLLISICAVPYILSLAGYDVYRMPESSSGGGGGGGGGSSACGGGGGGCGGGCGG